MRDLLDACADMSIASRPQVADDNGEILISDREMDLISIWTKVELRAARGPEYNLANPRTFSPKAEVRRQRPLSKQQSTTIAQHRAI
ncbi:MAG: hypothetical protein BMS9Abin02_1770 [Anaerolineae bacterium]|nr:MAG: hypothetical protein BMS9Abin02_1770 [Anaerolineae bacterium]